MNKELPKKLPNKLVNNLVSKKIFLANYLNTRSIIMGVITEIKYHGLNFVYYNLRCLNTE